MGKWIKVLCWICYLELIIMVMMKTTTTAMKSIWFYPLGSLGTVSLHLSVETPMIEPKYKFCDLIV